MTFFSVLGLMSLRTETPYIVLWSVELFAFFVLYVPGVEFGGELFDVLRHLLGIIAPYIGCILKEIGAVICSIFNKTQARLLSSGEENIELQSQDKMPITSDILQDDSDSQNNPEQAAAILAPPEVGSDTISDAIPKINNPKTVIIDLADYVDDDDTAQPEPNNKTTVARPDQNEWKYGEAALLNEILELKSQLRVKDRQIKTLGRKLDWMENDPDQVEYYRTRLSEESQQMERTYNEMIGLRGRLDEKDRTIDSLKQQNAATKKVLQAAREREERYIEQNIESNRQNQKLRRENFNLRKRVNSFQDVCENLNRIGEGACSDLRKIAAVLVAHALWQRGIQPDSLGIDGSRLQAHYDWAKEVAGLDLSRSPLQPSGGFRLKGVIYPLSKTRVEGTTVVQIPKVPLSSYRR